MPSQQQWEWQGEFPVNRVVVALARLLRAQFRSALFLPSPPGGGPQPLVLRLLPGRGVQVWALARPA
jgi:hypothetical protein